MSPGGRIMAVCVGDGKCKDASLSSRRRCVVSMSSVLTVWWPRCSAGSTAKPSSSSARLLEDSSGPALAPSLVGPRAGVLNMAVVRGGDGMAGDAFELHVV